MLVMEYLSDLLKKANREQGFKNINRRLKSKLIESKLIESNV